MSDEGGDDPAAAVDALVAAIAPRLEPPVISRRDVVLVTGPWMAGVSGLVTALRDRLPQQFVETTELGPGDAPTAVVFVVSAAAHLTESDCALLDAAAEHTDVVIGAVAKIDVHRNWRDVLAANRELLAAHAGRYGQVPWVGVAAVPDLGEPIVDEVVDILGAQLADPPSRDETGCGRGYLGCRPSRSGSTATPTAPVGGCGSTHCVKSAARPCGSGARRNPNAPARCAGRSSRRRSSCPTSRATDARRCVPNCNPRPRSCPDAICPASRRIPGSGRLRW